MKTEEMELLVRVAETGSMTRAARQLQRTPAAVSAAVQRIEGQLGVRIFERTTRSLHPTEEGQVVLEGCADVLSRWRRTLDDARDQRTDLAGTVHIAAPTDTAVQVLTPVLAQLGGAHPRLRVVVSASDTVQHLGRDALDLAIRYGRLPDSTLSARRLARVPIVLVASPAYVASRGAPADIADLGAHRCLTLHKADQPQVAWWLTRDGETTRVPIDSPLCGDGLLARRWALDGLGIAHKSLLDVIDDLEAGRLVRVLPGVTGGMGDIHAVSPSRTFQPARVRAVREALVDAFAARSARCGSWLARDAG